MILIIVVIIIIIVILTLLYINSSYSSYSYMHDQKSIPRPSSVLGVPLEDISYTRSELDQFAAQAAEQSTNPINMTGTIPSTSSTSSTLPSPSPSSSTATLPAEGESPCLVIFNSFRKIHNLPPFQAASQAQIDCANKAAQYDAAHGYHASFYNGMCAGASAQCEGSKGVAPQVPIPEKLDGPDGSLKQCIAAYISEGYGGFPTENKGHWNIITNKFAKISCGTDNNGFHTHTFYAA